MKDLCRNFRHKLTFSSRVVNLALALFMTVFANRPFWHVFSARLGLDTVGHWAFLFMTAMMITIILNSLLSLFSFKPVYKPAVIALLLISAVVNYYMVSYGIVINKQMIANLLETDFREASEQFTWPFFRHILLLGIAPSLLLGITRVTYGHWKKELLERTAIICGSALLLAALVLVNFKSITLFGRRNPELRMYINPTYPLYSLIKVVAGKSKSPGEPVRVVAADAIKPAATHKTVLVLVVGETARAEQFSLNGYQRQTNPELTKIKNVFNFYNVEACGTDTAESLPCMFSPLGRSSYSRSEAMKQENILDILQRTGVNVLWRDNNSGSKGVADRIPVESLSNEKDAALCSTEECFDEILLKDLDKVLAKNQGDMLLVLHQKGSHGPSYYKRSPENRKIYRPECTQDNVQDCEPQSIINAYDNTIVYTDYFLARLIERLQKENYPAAMLYVSDHGESLGENNIYLHGLPYSIAPGQQTHIPMVFWGSDSYLRDKGIDSAILRKQLGDHFSHDFIFHTMLGLFGIKSEIYKPDLYLFRAD